MNSILNFVYLYRTLDIFVCPLYSFFLFITLSFFLSLHVVCSKRFFAPYRIEIQFNSFHSNFCFVQELNWSTTTNKKFNEMSSLNVFSVCFLLLLWDINHPPSIILFWKFVDRPTDQPAKQTNKNLEVRIDQYTTTTTKQWKEKNFDSKWRMEKRRRREVNHQKGVFENKCFWTKKWNGYTHITSTHIRIDEKCTGI